MIAALALIVALQTSPARDARGPSRGTAVLSGVVVGDDAEARPVRKARVTCSSPDASGHTTITDDRGRFEFAGLPAGRYAVTASKGTPTRSGMPPNDRPTSKACSVTARSQN